MYVWRGTPPPPPLPPAPPPPPVPTPTAPPPDPIIKDVNPQVRRAKMTVVIKIKTSTQKVQDH